MTSRKTPFSAMLAEPKNGGDVPQALLHQAMTQDTFLNMLSNHLTSFSEYSPPHNLDRDHQYQSS